MNKVYIAGTEPGVMFYFIFHTAFLTKFTEGIIKIFFIYDIFFILFF
jgi:hypothetical protein